MKYFAKKVVYNGITFDSKTEAQRYAFLKQEADRGIITELEMQKEFELIPKQTKQIVKHLKTKDKIVTIVDEKAVRYHADFYYYDSKTDRYIIEEVKSKMTAKVRDYPLRRKLVKLMVKKMNAEIGYEKFAFNEVIA